MLWYVNDGWLFCEQACVESLEWGTGAETSCDTHGQCGTTLLGLQDSGTGVC